MAELTNPLFEDEKEFLERQKLEYERALLGDVEEIKERTQQVSKYVAIGAGVIGGIWLLSKAFGSKKDKALRGRQAAEDGLPPRTARSLRKSGHPVASLHSSDDTGFGVGHQADRGQQAVTHGRAQLAPDVYHAKAAASSNENDGTYDPFQPVSPVVARPLAPARQTAPRASQSSSEASSIMADTFRVFLQSDTGKMLVAQATAVLMGVVAKKLHEYLPMLKNPDLATSSAEPETRDISFTYHDDDANAPHKSL